MLRFKATVLRCATSTAEPPAIEAGQIAFEDVHDAALLIEFGHWNGERRKILPRDPLSSCARLKRHDLVMERGRVDRPHHITGIDVQPSNPKNRHVDCSHCASGQGRSKARSPDRVWHPGNHHVVGLKKGATKGSCLIFAQPSVGAVPEVADAHVGQLSQSHRPGRVLILRLDPIAVGEQPAV